MLFSVSSPLFTRCSPYQEHPVVLGHPLRMKFSGLMSCLAVAGTATAASVASRKSDSKCKLPTTKIANIEVVYTPLVQDAVKLIEQFIPLQPYLYSHLMRSWLFGAAALNNNATLKALVDLELHAVGTMLHDLGWDS
jgi:hypothetical protein